MNPEAQRIAIAEWCGWKPNPPCYDGVIRLYRNEDSKPPRTRTVEELPSYLNDLNAMHEAEGRLIDEQVNAFEAHLNAAISKDCRVCYFSLYASDKLWNATAKHRAEALLRTIGKWQE